jgi:hypothetical protein
MQLTWFRSLARFWPGQLNDQPFQLQARGQFAAAFQAAIDI